MALYIFKPQETEVNRLLLEQKKKSLSYYPVKGTLDHATKEQFQSDPKYADFNVDGYRVYLGQGKQIFDRACEGLKAWKQFEMGWVELFYPDTPLQEGSDVVILARVGTYNLSACRVVYVIEEDTPQSHRFGFAYGTLEMHVERGESRFIIEWDKTTDRVIYDVLSYSNHNTWFTKVAAPVARYIQQMFGAESVKALQRWVNGTTQITWLYRSCESFVRNTTENWSSE
ncbi:hypothetical protein PROFUN_00560 [Planoprotostelium fungivorum]|uniref:DUF1990 domain-containing protein n=1 Tax=Planoprotostelium fungivorum TaxID=1890364 RepID=A0A2P6N178_9EUKA|nr:hypothetical protein PROFUN_00560 [Planoprotostelium fungivorum]